MIGECVKSDTRREKLKGKREVCRRSNRRQELQSCIRSEILQAANGVHSAVVSLSSLQHDPSCTVLNTLHPMQSTYLFRMEIG